MPEATHDGKSNKVVEFREPNNTTDTMQSEARILETKVEEISPEKDEPKPTMYHGVEFPAYFQGPHFVEIKGSLVMAIDSKCVTMGMKTNWERYRHELAALGKKVVEKNLKIKIETV